MSEFYNKEQLNEKKAKKIINAANIYFSLNPNDTIEAILGQSSPFIVVTNNEVLYLGGMFEQKRFSISSITGVNITSSLFAKIELTIGGGKSEVLDTLSMMYEATLMRDFILSKINNQAIKNNGISASDEISKFFDLKEKGIITEKEFQAKKKQLLNL
ncbi:SHOCT domain-containing protein [Clostridium aminobutyricum]|uniref:SHOCT domain-containing protein n=1 Tax=Clostridium aminobutyricum TaxID=33953 RepID=A0A939D845_CLOAM|nr:SHOCT domain-containing protein [Clostridium aminobutyricum]MBN7772473.1 SHOCT domain-containing protein [Clostridium aminobutyricum]